MLYFTAIYLNIRAMDIVKPQWRLNSFQLSNPWMGIIALCVHIWNWTRNWLVADRWLNLISMRHYCTLMPCWHSLPGFRLHMLCGFARYKCYKFTTKRNLCKTRQHTRSCACTFHTHAHAGWFLLITVYFRYCIGVSVHTQSINIGGGENVRQSRKFFFLSAMQQYGKLQFNLCHVPQP